MKPLRVVPLVCAAVLVIAQTGSCSVSQGLKFDWIVAPATVAERQAGWAGLHFSVDDKGRPWLFHDKDQLASPSEGMEFSLSAEADDAVFLGRGAPLVSTLGDLETVGVAALTRIQGGKAMLPLTPIRRMPRVGCRLAPGASRAVYCICSHGKEHEVYALRPKESLWRQIIVSTNQPTAVAGDGAVTYIAYGDTITKADKKLVAIARLAEGPVRDLAYEPGIGLFYATSTGVGRVVSGKLLGVIDVDRAQIRAHQGALYIFSESDWGIVKATGF